jgi:dTDP-glucose 4,6-dehydratase
MQNVLVTGGLGFIGSNLIALLLKEKYFVINIDKVSYSSNFYNTKEYKKNKNYIFIKCNLNNKDKFLKIINKYKPTGIFNLAAETHVDRSIDVPKNFIYSNIVGIFNLLEIFKKYSIKNKKVKLIHISTDEVYGDIKKGRSKETDSYNPSSPYAATKAASDHLISSYVKTYKIPAIITNCSNNYGPFQFPEKLIPLTIHNALTDKEIPIYGDGQQIRDWLYVIDHCSAIRCVLEAGQVGEMYNIGGYNEMTNLEIVNTICSILDELQPRLDGASYKSQIQFVKDRLGHDKRYAINATKIEKNLKWRPSETLETGIQKTIKWYLGHQDWVTNITNRDYDSWVAKHYT